MCRKLLMLFLALFLAACQGSPAITSGPSPTETLSPTFTPLPTMALLPTDTSSPTVAPSPTIAPSPIPTIMLTRTPGPFPENFTGSAQVGEVQLTMNCDGTGEPTLIFENGLDYPSWESANIRFSQLTRACTYLRGGMNLYDVITSPRTAQDQVADLHSLLQQTGVPGPYILVGHSIAAANLLLYTQTYPKEVVGMVCVDCGYPAYYQIFLDKLGQPDPNDSPAVTQTRDDFQKWLAGSFVDDWKTNKEKLDVIASDQMVLQVSSLGNLPFVVLVASSREGSGDIRLDQADEEAWMDAQKQLTKLSSHSRMEVVPNTNHTTILDNEAVDKAIQEVYDAVKDE